MTQRTSMLSEDIKNMLNVLSEQLDIPEYDSIRITLENVIEFTTDKPLLKVNDLLTLDQFSSEYEALKGKGYSWLNLQAAGIFENKLVCILECPKNSSNSVKTSINFSGPFRSIESGEFDWNLEHHYELII